MSDYELSIISEDKKTKNETYQIFQLEDESVIGVHKEEPFAVRFRNNTNEAVQVRLSVDGTDILTGKPASTKPSGKMWLVEAHDYLELRAWPEDTEGGARFVFSSEDQSVAVNTHGSKAGIGLIAAAVYVENPTRYRPAVNYSSGSIRFLQNEPIPRRMTRSRRIGENVTKGVDPTLFSSNSASFNLTSDCDPVAASGETFDSLAVGAGEHVEQQITKKAGLAEPVLNDVMQIRYMPWQKLEKLLAKQTPKGSNAFPGDKPEKMIDLSKVPKPKKAKQLERFA